VLVIMPVAELRVWSAVKKGPFPPGPGLTPQAGSCFPELGLRMGTQPGKDLPGSNWMRANWRGEGRGHRDRLERAPAPARAGHLRP